MSEPRKYVIVLPSYFKPTLRMLPEYRNWSAIKSRCTNKKFDKKKRYVWRGITMCSRWQFGENGVGGFECFLADMGHRPGEKFSVERIDNDGNYEPGNCKWATNKEQSNNRSNNHKLTFRGETTSMMTLAERHGVSYYVLRNRINRGWPVEDALFKPLGTALFKPKTAQGNSLPQARLTETEVREIRRVYSEGDITMEQLAIRFSISAASVCLLVNRKSWKHVV